MPESGSCYILLFSIGVLWSSWKTFVVCGRGGGTCCPHRFSALVFGNSNVPGLSGIAENQFCK